MGRPEVLTRELEKLDAFYTSLNYFPYQARETSNFLAGENAGSGAKMLANMLAKMVAGNGGSGCLRCF